MAPDDVVERVADRLRLVERADHRVDGRRPDVVARLDELDQLVHDRPRLGDLELLALDREPVAAQEDRAGEPVSQLVEDRVAHPRELRGDVVRDGENLLHPASKCRGRGGGGESRKDASPRPHRRGGRGCPQCGGRRHGRTARGAVEAGPGDPRARGDRPHRRAARAHGGGLERRQPAPRVGRARPEDQHGAARRCAGPVPRRAAAHRRAAGRDLRRRRAGHGRRDPRRLQRPRPDRRARHDLEGDRAGPADRETGECVEGEARRARAPARSRARRAACDARRPLGEARPDPELARDTPPAALLDSRPDRAHPGGRARPRGADSRHRRAPGSHAKRPRPPRQRRPAPRNSPPPPLPCPRPRPRRRPGRRRPRRRRPRPPRRRPRSPTSRPPRFPPGTRTPPRSRRATSACPTAGAAPPRPASTARVSSSGSTPSSESSSRISPARCTGSGCPSPATSSRPATSSSSTRSTTSGIYIGAGQFIHAPHTGDVVRVSTMSSGRYASSYVGARRV